MASPAVPAVVSAKRLTAAAAHLALAASLIIRDVAKPGAGNSVSGLVDKGVGDPQTVADRRAQRFIESSLKLAFPDVLIVGEEGDLKDIGNDESDDAVMPDLKCLDDEWPDDKDIQLPLDQVCVWIDPLDATREFTRGNFQYVGTMIGVSVGGKAFCGAVCEPYYHDFPHPVLADSAAVPGQGGGRCMWGCAGAGLHMLGSPGWTRPAAERPPVVVTSLSRTGPELQAAIDKIPGAVSLRAGGAGHKLLRVADGSADVWLSPTSMSYKWDTCAGEALLHAAGGCVTDRHGNPLTYVPGGDYGNREGVLAASSRAVLDLALAACRGMGPMSP